MAEDFYVQLQKIIDQYPQALPILKNPGVFDVYSRAITEGWSAARITAALEATPWWTSTTESARQFQALQITDPATATQRATDTKRILDDAMMATGVHLSNDGGLSSQAFQFLAKATTQGWDAARIRYELLAIGGGHGGDVATQATSVQKLANDYGLPMSDQRAMDYATKLAQGAIDLETVQGDLLAQAKSLYPTLSEQLDRGFTVRQIADPYLQLAQRELGVDPTTVNLTDQKWIGMFNQVDPQTGQRTTMSMDAWLSKIRTDPTYGYDKTSQGKQSATDLATQLQRKMGAAA